MMPTNDKAAYKKNLMDNMDGEGSTVTIPVDKAPDPVGEALTKAMEACKKGDMKACEAAIQAAVMAHGTEETDETANEAGADQD